MTHIYIFYVKVSCQNNFAKGIKWSLLGLKPDFAGPLDIILIVIIS